MSTISLICKQCGGQLDFDSEKTSGREFGFCRHCGTKFLFNDEIINNTYNTTYQTTIIKNIDGSAKTDADELILSAETLIGLGEWQKAKNVLDKAIETYPSDWRTWFGMVKYCTANFNNLSDTTHRYFLEKAKAVVKSEERERLNTLYKIYLDKIAAENRRRAAELARQRQEEERIRQEKIRKWQEGAPKRKKIYIFSSIAAAACAVLFLAIFLPLHFTRDVRAENARIRAEQKAEQEYIANNTLTVSYTYLNEYGNEITKTATYIYDRTTPDLTISDRPGYEFTLYTSATEFTEQTRYNFNHKPETKQISLWARITPIIYAINFENLQNGSNPNITEYTIESSSINFTAPARDGYLGMWDITSIASGSIGEKTITAIWMPIVYNINYDNLLDGTHTNIATYTIESETLKYNS